jgi:hypothetical protein
VSSFDLIDNNYKNDANAEKRNKLSTIILKVIKYITD